MVLTITRADVERELLRELVAEELGIDPHAPETPLFSPLPGPQTRAFESEAFIVGYGGAAGGGKSLLELGLAVTKHKKSIVFRRHKEDVKDLWSKLRMLCTVHGRPNETSKEWRDLPGDRYVRLVGLQHLWDWLKFQGQEHDLWAFDEATQFPELPIRTLMAWCRSPDPTQRCQVVLGFNPPTSADGEWIIDFFAPWLDPQHPNPAEPGELRWYARLDDADVAVSGPEPFEHHGEMVTPLSRTFFPARLEDNPILEATGYRATLQGMPEPLRSQMLFGDFTVGLDDDEYQVIPTSWVRAAQQRWSEGGHDDAPVHAVGADVAQGGRDNTVTVARRGTWFGQPSKTPGSEVPDAAENAKVIRAALELGGYANIDSDGIGASTYHLLRPELGSRVRSYRGSEQRPNLRDRSGVFEFANVRAAAWWNLRELLDPARYSTVALPPGREVLADLTAPRWLKVGDKIRLEKKDEIKERLGRSPDCGDALVMAAWNDPAADLAEAMGRGMSYGGAQRQVRTAVRGAARGRR